MEEGYLFAGKSNQYCFTQGLARIGKLDNSVLLYCNDAKGVARWRDILQLKLPPTMLAMKPPDMNVLDPFLILASGRKRANISKRAAAIECYFVQTEALA